MHEIADQPTLFEKPLERDLSRLRRAGVDSLLLGALFIWLLYMASSFRLPFNEITISDANASGAVRQLVFAGTGLLALLRLTLTRSLGALLVANWQFSALAAFILGSFLWSELPSFTMKRGLIFVFGFLGLATVIHGSKRPVGLMLKSVVYFTGLVAIASLLFHVVLPQYCTVNPERPGLAGISDHPNTIAPFFSIGFLLSLGLQSNDLKLPLLLRIFQVALLLGLALSFSVTTWVTTMVGFGIYIFLNSTSYFRGIIQISTLITIVLVAAIGVQTLKSDFFQATGRDESLSGRDELWAVTWYEAKKKPFIGHGYGAFWTEGKGRELVQTWNPRQTHHSYLDAMLDLGLVGLILILLIFPFSLYLSWISQKASTGAPLRKASAAMVSAAVSYMVIYAFSQSYFLRFDSFPFFILAWITLLMTNRSSNSMNAEFSRPEADNATHQPQLT